MQLKNETTEEQSAIHKNEIGQTAFEKHFTVAEISELWQLDKKTVRRLFEHEPEVFSFGSSESRVKRRYRTLRIPESVMVKVHRKMTKIG
jgi:hypothetical protein